MSDDKITGEEVAQWLKDNDKKAAWLAKTISVTPATVSRWLNGKNPISGSDEAVLKLLIRGEMPFEIVNEKLLHGVLDFTEDQWLVITVIATRNATTPGKWIADKVRWMLAGDDEARAELAKQEQLQQQGQALSLVADAPNPEATPHKGSGSYRTAENNSSPRRVKRIRSLDAPEKELNKRAGGN